MFLCTSDAITHVFVSWKSLFLIIIFQIERDRLFLISNLLLLLLLLILFVFATAGARP